MSSIDMGLDYDRTVMLTCKLLFAAAKSAPALMSYVCWAFFFFTTKGGGGYPPCCGGWMVVLG